MTGQDVERAVSSVTDVLLVPVLVLALAALALALVEAGRLVVEVTRRRGRSIARLDRAVAAATPDGVREVAGSARMATAAEALLAAGREPGDVEARRAKLLADFDYASLKALERPRVLVRAGPALGLMGTLIPLSPALEALSRGDVARLAQDLRVAFSVTVLGLLTGAIAFAVSLVRDRLSGQDLSDLEYLAAGLP